MYIFNFTVGMMRSVVAKHIFYFIVFNFYDAVCRHPKYGTYLKNLIIVVTNRLMLDPSRTAFCVLPVKSDVNFHL